MNPEYYDGEEPEEIEIERPPQVGDTVRLMIQGYGLLGTIEDINPDGTADIGVEDSCHAAAVLRENGSAIAYHAILDDDGHTDVVEYDVEMIRDFLEHLTWELRAFHFENSAATGSVNPELVEMLSKYIDKRRTACLLPATQIQLEGLEEWQADERMDRYRAAKAQMASKALEYLEALSQLFDGALACAENPRTFAISQTNLADALDQLDEQDNEDDQE